MLLLPIDGHWEGRVKAGQIVSHFRILETLGRGGMGVVYRAEDTRLARPVALKFIAPHLVDDAQAKERFLREARAAAILNHPNICTIHEIDEVEGQLFIAMAYVEGETLADRLRDGPFDPEDAIEIAIQIARGLEAAHARGIIHRDIKPANVKRTPAGSVVILDFGLAKVGGTAEITGDRTIMGTPGYMSPEQICGEPVGMQADIWALGVVLYEMIAGERPFPGENAVAVSRAVLDGAPKPFVARQGKGSRDLDSVVGWMLEKRPERRCPSASEALRRLEGLRAAGHGAADVAPTAPTVAMTHPDPSIAVLPFANMSADSEQEYFCDGIAEEIINALAQLRGLRVIARTSAFAFKGRAIDLREIGRQLGVEAILEGGVRKSGNRLRITAQLIDVHSGYHTWSARYDRQLDDVFAIQEEIAQAIVGRLSAGIGGDQAERSAGIGTRIAEAYDLVLMGRFYWRKLTEQDLAKALECFEKASGLDPDYAAAQAGLADVYCDMRYLGLLSAADSGPKAEAAARRALHLDPMLAEAHVAMGWVHRMFTKDMHAAEKHLRLATELNPGSADAHERYALVVAGLDRVDDAIHHGMTALRMDPLSVMTLIAMAQFKRSKWDWSGAAELLKRAMAIDPTAGMPRSMYGYHLICRGRGEEGVAEMRLATEIAPQENRLALFLGEGLQRIGRYDEALTQARAAIERSAVPVSGDRLVLGLCYLGKGMYEDARREIEAALEIARDGKSYGVAFEASATLGIAYAMMGDREKARSVLDELSGHVDDPNLQWSLLAKICFALGDPTRGIELLERACDRNEVGLADLKIYPGYEPVHAHPRFLSLLRRINLGD